MSDKVVRQSGPMHRILEYTPPKFEMGVPEAAQSYIELKKTQPKPFKMAEHLRVQTGVQQIEEVSLEDQVENRTIEKLKEVQEAAYQEAYALGLSEGKKEAFDASSKEINARLQELDQTLVAISDLKKELTLQNEAHIAKLAFHIAEKLAYHTIEANHDVVVEVIRKAVELAQIEEEVTVQVAPTQLEFLNKLKTETGREYEFLKKIKLVSSDGVKEGGCIIETNYGHIDARFDERVKQVWGQFAESLHRVKDKISAA